MYDAGMSFGLGEDIEALREGVRRFAAERIAPLAAEIDRNNNFPMPLRGLHLTVLTYCDAIYQPYLFLCNNNARRGGRSVR